MICILKLDSFPKIVPSISWKLIQFSKFGDVSAVFVFAIAFDREWNRIEIEALLNALALLRVGYLFISQLMHHQRVTAMYLVKLT